MMRSTIRTFAAALVVWWACPGCAPTVPAEKYDQLHQQWLDSMQDKDNLARQNEQLQKANKEVADQVETLRRLGPERLQKLFCVTFIQLGRHTGGVDLDGRTGDDAIRVYLDPLDRHGSTIKVAGEVAIRLFDLAEPAEKNLIGEYNWSVDELAGQWRGGFGVYRFSFVCPWKAGPPKHDEITVRVEFVDYLTGRRFSAQKACKVRLPLPGLAPSAATAPGTLPWAEQPQPSTEPAP
jgi:hypothetical protein